MNGPAGESRVVMLTGAASGIGRYLAGEFIRRGDRLLASDLDPQVLRSIAGHDGWSEKQLLLAGLDVRDPQAWQQALEQVLQAWGRLDVLVNVAGIIQPGLVHQATPKEIDLHMDVNAKGVMYGTQAAAAHMVRQGRGHIVNIASMAALAPVPGIALYSASKWAVRGFSLAAAHELAPHGVRVSVICPDAVQTPMLDKQLDYQEAALTFSAARPLSVEQVGRAVLEQALARGQLEVMLPWTRGYLSKLASFFPALGAKLLPGLTAKGLRQQARAKAEHAAHTGGL